MAFKREYLKTIGLNEEQITAVMEAHTEVTDALKKQRDDLKADVERLQAEADKLPAIQTELDTMKNREDFKPKYDEAVKALDDYKAQVAREKETEQVKAAYRKLLQDEQISANWIDDIMSVTNFDGMKLDAEGKLDGIDGLKQTIGEKYAKFRTVTRQRGENVARPPVTGQAKPTKEEIMAIKDTAERQKAIAANHELFGF